MWRVRHERRTVVPVADMARRPPGGSEDALLNSSNQLLKGHAAETPRIAGEGRRGGDGKKDFAAALEACGRRCGGHCLECGPCVSRDDVKDMLSRLHETQSSTVNRDKHERLRKVRLQQSRRRHRVRVRMCPYVVHTPPNRGSRAAVVDDYACSFDDAAGCDRGAAGVGWPRPRRWRRHRHSAAARLCFASAGAGGARLITPSSHG